MSNETTKIEVGAVCQLKSGGPTMTVSDCNDAVVVTLWFDGTALCSGEFTPATLRLVDESKDA